MKFKFCINYIFTLLAALFLILTSCEQQEAQPFSSDNGINFLIPDGTDDYKDLSSTFNFYTYYVAKGLEFNNLDIQLMVQLEGRLSDKPTNIRLKVVPEEGYEMPEIILPADSVIEAGEYRRTITIICRRPAEYDKEYRAIVTFDYDNSDVVPGTKERQQYEVIVSDAIDWSGMRVANEEEWNRNLTSVLGEYGPVKARFIMAALGKMGKSYQAVNNLYIYTVTRPQWGFSTVIDDLKEALKTYNDEHEANLQEADGTLVTFN